MQYITTVTLMMLRVVATVSVAVLITSSPAAAARASMDGTAVGTTETIDSINVSCTVSGTEADDLKFLIQWTCPEDCVIVFTVSWIGHVLWSDEEITGSDTTSQDSWSIDDVQPYTSYEVTVSWQNERKSETCSETTPETAPSAPLDLLSLKSNSSTSLAVQWHQPEDINGVISKYTVTWRLQDWNETPDEGNEVITDALQQTTFTYTIEGLQNQQQYNVTVAASTIIEGPSVCKVFKTSSDGPTNDDTSIIVEAVAATAVMLLIILILVFFKRDWIKDKFRRKEMKTENGYYENEHNYFDKLTEEIEKKLKAFDDEEVLQAEFSQMAAESYVGLITIALQPKNRRKNRYINILPFDDTLVSLSRDGYSGYINASRIESEGENEASFIGCQGPKENTVEDFWWLVWEQNVATIVMLTNCTEGGRSKCTQYWPVSVNTFENFNTFLVTLHKEENKPGYTVRTLSVEKDEETKYVKQFHFTDWPDFGVPRTEVEILNLLSDVRGHCNSTKPRRSIIVHCSAGVGRTGTFIGLWQLEVKAENRATKIDVRQNVMNMRRYRNNLVQSKEQYKYMITCFKKYLEMRSQYEIEKKLDWETEIDENIMDKITTQSKQGYVNNGYENDEPSRKEALNEEQDGRLRQPYAPALDNQQQKPTRPQNNSAQSNSDSIFRRNLAVNLPPSHSPNTSNTAFEKCQYSSSKLSQSEFNTSIQGQDLPGRPSFSSNLNYSLKPNIPHTHSGYQQTQSDPFQLPSYPSAQPISPFTYQHSTQHARVPHQAFIPMPQPGNSLLQTQSHQQGHLGIIPQPQHNLAYQHDSV